ncbi:hypothetical protein LguiB_006782 [Lonicera macranthoides]
MFSAELVKCRSHKLEVQEGNRIRPYLAKASKLKKDHLQKKATAQGLTRPRQQTYIYQRISATDENGAPLNDTIGESGGGGGGGRSESLVSRSENELTPASQR